VHELHTVNGFVVVAVGFPTHCIRHTGPRHEIAFVATIDKHSGPHNGTAIRSWIAAVLQHHFHNPIAVFLYLAEAGVIQYLETAFAHVVMEYGKGDLRFKNPLFELAVMSSDTPVKIAGKTRHGILITDVGLPQTS